MKVGPDIYLYEKDAKVLKQIREGKELNPTTINLDDLVKLAFLLAEDDFSKARELAEKIVARRGPMFVVKSSSLVDNTNQNHLKINLFGR